MKAINQPAIAIKGAVIAPGGAVGVIERALIAWGGAVGVIKRATTAITRCLIRFIQCLIAFKAPANALKEATDARGARSGVRYRPPGT